MKTVPMRAITVVARAHLENQLCERLRQWGVAGYSVSESLNNASLECHSSEITDRHIRIEAVVTPAVAHTILEGLKQEYFSQFSVVYFVSDTTSMPLLDSPSTDSDSCQLPREQTWGDYVISL